jgi:hypothetical protein
MRLALRGSLDNAPSHSADVGDRNSESRTPRRIHMANAIRRFLETAKRATVQEVPTLASDMGALFLHQNFPGQFVHVARALKARGDEVVAITDKTNSRPDIVPTRRYAFDKRAVARGHRLAVHFAMRAARGEAVASEMLKLRGEAHSVT